MMMKKAKDIIRLLLPDKIIKLLVFIKKEYLDGYSLKSYSQEGEDMIIRRIFDKQTTGCYVDVGAYHPKRFSNTYFFYKKGWKGINIDAMPRSMKLFKKFRPKDINLEVAISEKTENLIYYMFNEPAFNGFSKELSEVKNSEGNYHLISERIIKTSTLKEVLDRYLPKRREIDFLSVDAEGFDLNVLKSNNWVKYRPKIVLVESIQSTLEEISNDEIYRYLKGIGYILYAKTANTLIFKLE